MCRYQRLIKDKNELIQRNNLILDDITNMLNRKDNYDFIQIPIEAILMISRLDEDQIAQIAPKITPKLLKLFKTYHNEGLVG